MAIGDASDARAVLVVLHGGATSLRSINYLTVGGILATPCALASVNGGVTAIYGALVPSGTTADVVLAWSGSQDRSACSTYATEDIASFTPFDTGSDLDNSSPYSTSLDIPEGGFALAGLGTHNSSSGTFTWSGLSGDAQVNVESNRWFVSGSGSFASAQTGLTTQVAFSGSSGVGRPFLAASFSPRPKVAPKFHHYRQRRI